MFSQIASHDSSRWALPFVAWGVVYGFFRLVDDNTSADIRRIFSSFLKEGKYESYLGSFPTVIEGLFLRTVGDNHLSFKCVRRSISLSIISLTASIMFSVIWNYDDFKKALIQLAAIPDIVEKALNASPQTKYIALNIENLGPIGFWILVSLLWLTWCFIPEYVSLFKTRIIILIIKNTKLRVSSLIFTMVIDLIASTWSFLTTILFLQVFLLLAFTVSLGKISLVQILPHMVSVTMATSGIVIFLESLIMSPDGGLYFGIPVGNLFWASMTPSIILWIYIFSTLVTRVLLTSKPLFRGLISILDVNDHPIRAVGLVAASITLVTFLGCIVALTPV